jgi:hypothetical protein
MWGHAGCVCCVGVGNYYALMTRIFLLGCVCWFRVGLCSRCSRICCVQSRHACKTSPSASPLACRLHGAAKCVRTVPFVPTLLCCSGATSKRTSAPSKEPIHAVSVTLLWLGVPVTVLWLGVRAVWAVMGVVCGKGLLPLNPHSGVLCLE